MRAPEAVNFQNIAATTGNFELRGGAYVLDAVGNFNGGSVSLQRLGPDGATFITAATALSAVGSSGAIALPPGTYNIAIASATGLSVSVVRIPGE